MATYVEAITLVDLSSGYSANLVRLLQHNRPDTMPRKLVRGGQTGWPGPDDNNCLIHRSEPMFEASLGIPGQAQLGCC
jgi:hypothetical protein